MIGEDKELVFVTFQIVIPSYEGFNDSQKLTVMSFISSFYKNYLFE